MFFTSTEQFFKIISVLELDWKENNVPVAPRPYHALSFRLKGDSIFNHDPQLQAATNDLLYMPADTPYHLLSGEEHIIVIHFEITGGGAQEIELFHPKNSVVFEEAFRSISEVWLLKRNGYYQKAMSIFYKILEQLSLQFSPLYSALSYQQIKDAVTYIHTHFNDSQLRIAQLCEISHLSDTQFRKIFFDFFKTTPLRYINTLRTDYAAELLESSFLSIEEITQKAGFTDSKHFSTVFKQYKKFAPAIFRKNCNAATIPAAASVSDYSNISLPKKSGL